jgi:hypothetical protein
MTRIVDFPLVGGMDQGVDRIFQADGKLQYAQNVRMTRDGRLECRPTYETLSTATMSNGSLIAYDVANYAGRLVALGTQVNVPRASDIFEWLPTTQTAGVWRGTAGDDATLTGVRLPQVTDVRRIALTPDQQASARRVSIAAGGGYLCVLIDLAPDPGFITGLTSTTILVIDPATDQTVMWESVPFRASRVVFAGTRFWIFGVDASENIVSVDLVPGTTEALAAPTTRVAATTTVADLALATFGTGFALTFAITGTTNVRTYNSTGVQQVAFTAFASSSNALAMVGNSAGTLLSVMREAGGVHSISTFNAAGTLQTGPTTLFGGVGTASAIGLAIDGSGTLTAIGFNFPDSLIQLVIQAGHALGSLVTYYNATLMTGPAFASSTMFAGFQDTSTDKTFHLVDTGTLLPQAFLLPQLVHGSSNNDPMTITMAVAGSKLYFGAYSEPQSTGLSGRKSRYAVWEAETLGTNRRQMAQVGGELLISGGLPLTYDGRAMAEQGFAETPRIALVSQDTSGQLTLLGTYNFIAVWQVFDGRGNELKSIPSDPQAVTLTGANDGINLTVTTPHSLRRLPAYRDQNLSVRVSLYRTEANQGVFFLDKETTIDPLDDVAELVAISSTQSDLSLSDNLVLYTQSQTPVAHTSPPPHKFVHLMHERALAGGATDDYSWVASKLLFPAEPLEWAGAGVLGFSSRVGQPITAVAAFETTGLIFTASQIYQIPGRGPERNGTGDFDAVQAIASPGGCIDWRSVLVTPVGCFFQMRSDMLMLLTRAGEVQWIGRAVQDQLALTPTITGATFIREHDLVVFACNSGGITGALICLDLSNGQWFVDTLASATLSITELNGRLVRVNTSGVVSQMRADPGNGSEALPTMRVEKQFKVFPLLGAGTVVRVMLLATYLGDCTVEGFISYDDSKTWTSMGQQAVTTANMFNPVSGSGLSSGDPVTIIFSPARREVDRFAVRFDVTNGTDTGAVRLNAISLEVDGNEFATRQPARNQR